MRVLRALYVLIPSFVVSSLAVSACSSDSKKTAPPLVDEGTGGAAGSVSAAGGKGGKSGASGAAGATAGAAGDAGAAGTGGLAGAGGSTGGASGAGGNGGLGGASGAAGSGGNCTPPTGGAAGVAGAAGAGGALPTCTEPATCHDMIVDADETDIDCGGACFLKCDLGKACKVGTDCVEGVCKTGTPTDMCGKGSCGDGVKNQDETDVDCGGASLCPKCGDKFACKVASDCVSGVCGSTGRCTPPSCMDKIQNGDETDVDCGGSCPGKCQLGQKCNGSPDCTTDSCATQKFCACPPGMVVAPKPVGGAYCIDATEVTYADYALFWQANPQANETGACSFKKKYTPTSGWPAPTDHALSPVRWVDWCDATAFCRFNKKHLCGNIGKEAGVPFNPTAATDPGQSEWYNACSASGVNLYPYGSSTFDASKCDGPGFMFVTNDPREPLDAAQMPSPPLVPYLVQSSQGVPITANSCQGGAPNLYDMSGNVLEWENSCSDNKDELDSCYLRGGSYEDKADQLTCKSLVTQARGYADEKTGFRCCL